MQENLSETHVYEITDILNIRITLKLNNKKTKQYKMATDIYRPLTKEAIQITIKYMKRTQHHISLENCKLKQ